MNIQITDNDKYTLVAVSGRLDATTYETFQKEAVDQTNGKKNILLDLSALEYISSSGLRSILFMAKRAASLCGFFALTGCSGVVMEVLKMSGFSGLINMYPSVKEASEQIS